MENTMTMTGAVEMTRAFPRVWSECPQALTTRLAVVPTPVQGTTLPISGYRAVGRAKDAPLAGIALKTMDVTPFRPGRPPV